MIKQNLDNIAAQIEDLRERTKRFAQLHTEQKDCLDSKLILFEEKVNKINDTAE